MSLAKAVNNLKFDKRLTEWCINNGQLTREEVNKYLQSLPDLADQVDKVSMADMDDDSSSDSH